MATSLLNATDGKAPRMGVVIYCVVVTLLSIVLSHPTGAQDGVGGEEPTATGPRLVLPYGPDTTDHADEFELPIDIGPDPDRNTAEPAAAESPASEPAAGDEAPNRSIPRPTVVTEPPPSTTPATSVSPTAPCLNTDYWIISTRKCPQHIFPDFSDDLMEYFHQDDKPGLVKSLRSEFIASIPPAIPICFVVHGSYTSFDQAVEESGATYRWLRRAAPDYPVKIVFFTWPSDQDLTYIIPLDVAILGRKSARNSVYLGRLISELPPDHPISFIGHSHGARLTASAMHLLSGGAIQNYRLPQPTASGRRMRAVMAAAAIDHNWLNPGEQYDQALTQTERMLNLQNTKDVALGLYLFRKPFSSASLGRSGFTWDDRWRLPNFQEKVAQLDVSSIIGSAHMWPHYYQHAGLATTLVPYVYFVDNQDTTPSTVTSNATLNRQMSGHGQNAGASRPFVKGATQAPTPLSAAPEQRISADYLPGINLNINLPPRR